MREVLHLQNKIVSKIGGVMSSKRARDEKLIFAASAAFRRIGVDFTGSRNSDFNCLHYPRILFLLGKAINNSQILLIS